MNELIKSTHQFHNSRIIEFSLDIQIVWRFIGKRKKIKGLIKLK